MGKPQGYFQKLGVYDYATKAEQQLSGGVIIGVRWVDVSKGDSEDLGYRSRLVGRELVVGKDDALYAATLHLGALRIIISRGHVPGRGPRARHHDQ